VHATSVRLTLESSRQKDRSEEEQEDSSIVVPEVRDIDETSLRKNTQKEDAKKSATKWREAYKPKLKETTDNKVPLHFCIGFPAAAKYALLNAKQKISLISE
jgi:hypothetical protein